MSKIKSALELAMEKTSDIEADRGAIERARDAKEAKRNTALYLEGKRAELLPQDGGSEAYMEAVKETLLTNIKLPRINDDLARLSPLEEGFALMAGDGNAAADVANLFGQLKNLLAQYLDTKEQLFDALAAQYEPQLRQREAALREQTGQAITLTADQDPEFLKLLRDQQTRMDDQYNQVIQQAKAQLSEIL